MNKLHKTICAAAVAGLMAVPFSAAHAWGNNWSPWGGNNYGNNGWGNDGWGDGFGDGNMDGNFGFNMSGSGSGRGSGYGRGNNSYRGYNRGYGGGYGGGGLWRRLRPRSWLRVWTWSIRCSASGSTGSSRCWRQSVNR